MINWPWYVSVALYILGTIFFGRYVRRLWKDKMEDPEELVQIAFWAGIWWPILGGGLLLHNLLSKKSPEPGGEE